MELIPFYVTAIRLAVPFAMLKWPKRGLAATILVDMADWKFINVQNSSQNAIYQSWDKTMDLYSWIFILIIMRTWKDAWAKKIAVFFFVYRACGLIVFWATHWRGTLFVFPNFFENFVILYLFTSWVHHKKKFNLSKVQKIFMLLVVMIPKTIHEYFQHVLNRQPSNIVNIGELLNLTGVPKELANDAALISLYYVFPMIAFLMYIKINLPTVKRQKYS